MVIDLGGFLLENLSKGFRVNLIQFSPLRFVFLKQMDVILCKKYI